MVSYVGLSVPVHIIDHKRDLSMTLISPIGINSGQVSSVPIQQVTPGLRSDWNEVLGDAKHGNVSSNGPP